MSGPKVVRIVTREEILEICLGHLARVDAALEEWTRVGRRNDCIDDDAIAAARRRRDALAALISADRFMDLQKQAPIEEAFIRADLQQRLVAVAAEQAQARSRERRESEAAAALLKRLRNAGSPLDPELEAGLERGDPLATSKGLLLLGGGSAPRTDADLAAELREGSKPLSFAEWVATQPVPPSDPALDRILSRLTEIRQIADAPEEPGWRARLAEAEAAPTSRRNLILDALEVETGRALTAARKRAQALTDLRITLAEAEASGLGTGAWSEGLDTLTTEAIDEHREAVSAALQVARDAKAVATRRAAVLDCLSGLGYEVSEGMTTAWAAEGRLVLRSAARAGYGVEMSGGERFQMRPVAFEADGVGPDPSRDRDAETIWCGDVGSLEERLAELGGVLQIQKSTPIGAVPLKRIPVSGTNLGAAADAPALRERTLR